MYKIGHLDFEHQRSNRSFCRDDPPVSVTTSHENQETHSKQQALPGPAGTWLGIIFGLPLGNCGQNGFPHEH